MIQKPTYEELEQRVKKLERIEFERKRAEEALKKSEDRFRAIFDKAPLGIVIVNSEGRFVEVNDYLLKTLAYSSEEIKALSFLDITHP